MSTSFPIRTPWRLRRSHPAARWPAGFTLVEIVLAIALSTLVLLASAVFVFSAFNLLTQTQNDPGLEHHKLGVVSYLEYAFSQAPPASNTTGGNTTGGGFAGGLPTASLGGPAGGAGGNSSNGANSNTSSNNGTGLPSLSSGIGGGAGTAKQTNRVSWGAPPGVPTLENPYLSFRVDDDDPLLVWENGPRPPATAWLYFKEGEGLSIIWQTDQQKTLDPNTVQRTIISPLVTKVGFNYYDPATEQWSESDTPVTDSTTGTQMLPTFLRLTFKINGKEEPMIVNIPAGTTTVPLY